MRMVRSMLFVPASRPAMVEKAAASAADGVCLDLEDSVTAADKTAARGHAARALSQVDFGSRLRLLRVNGLETALTYRDLVDVVEPAADRLDLVMIPKVQSAADVEFVDRLLTQIEGGGRGDRHIRLEAQIETARGFLYAREIAAASPRLDALVFGPGDFAASMRMPAAAIGELDVNDERYPGHRWHAVMQTIVAAARANGLRAMDGPYAGYTDQPGLERACRIARALGFDGKQCIHPAQLAPVNASFTPTPAEINEAAAVVDAYQRAVAAGQGAASHGGKMIDAATLRMARAILERR